ncbi:MAG TPA: ABC transporter permease [Aeromicrobium sp.]|nr:ABC transporter permease [Aeromicrobium sp.]
MTQSRLSRIGLAFAAPVLALFAAFVVTSLVLILAGDDWIGVWGQILSWPSNRSIVNILNAGTVYYLSAVAVAIGFRMNLFNIGVDGQYRIASFAAAWVAGEAWLPGYFNVVLAVLAGMFVGAMWAGIAGLLRVTRGVSEVISTIMLNAIATAVVAYLLRKVAVSEPGSNIISTKPVPESSRVPGIPMFGGEVYGFIVVAAIVGIGYWVLINRTRFGFDLRAAGSSESAAVSSGINVKKMILTTMLLSGAVAGLVGMPLLFGQDYAYGSTFQAGLGFTGIAVALLGRNHPAGIALGAILFAYLDEQSNPLQILLDVSPDIVKVTQGVIVLSVVIAYEVVRRYSVRLEQRQVAAALDAEVRPKEVAK